MKVVYLMIKCLIELNDLDKAISIIEKHLEIDKEDFQLKLALLKVYRLQAKNI